MAQTFRDYIVELENYEFSREYFDLMKECAELELQEKFLENQEFAATYGCHYTEAAGYCLTENYFAEAADEQQTETVKAEAGKKKVGIVRKILGLVKTALQKIAGFLRKMAKGLDSLAAKTDPIAKKLTKWNLTKEDATEIMTALKIGANDTYSKTVGPTVKSLKLKFTNVEDSERTAILHCLNILFEDEMLYFSPKDNGSVLPLSNYDGLVEINQLIEIIVKISKSGSGILNSFSGLDGAVKAVKTKGLYVSFNKDKIEKGIEELQENLKLFEETFSAENIEKMILEGNLSDEEAAKWRSIPIKNATLMKSIAATIRFYNDIIKYRADVAKNLTKFISDKEAFEASGAGNEPEEE